MKDILFKYLPRIIWLVLLVLCFRGRGSHAVFLLVALLVPTIGLFWRERREAMGRLLTSAWQAIERFTRAPNTTAIPWRALFLYGYLPMLGLALLNGKNISSMDNFPASLTAAAWVLDGTAELSKLQLPGEAEALCAGTIPAVYYLRCTSKGLYSAYPVGMAVVALPFTLLSRLLGTPLRDAKVLWRLAKWTSANWAAFGIMLFFLIALRWGKTRAAYVTTCLLMVGSPFLYTIGQGLWSQSGVAVGFLLVMALEFYGSKRRTLSDVLQGGTIALMLSCRLTAVALIMPYGLWLLLQSRRRFATVTLSAGMAFLPVLAFYQYTYGHLLGPQALMAHAMGSTPTPWIALWGLLVSPAVGLFVYQTWLVLAAGALWSARGLPKSLRVTFVVGILLQLGISAQWKEWWGGSWGSRYLTEVVPLFAFLALGTIEHIWNEKKGQVFTIGLGLLSFVVIAPVVFGGSTQWFYSHPKRSNHFLEEQRRMFDWCDPPFLYSGY